MMTQKFRMKTLAHAMAAAMVLAVPILADATTVTMNVSNQWDAGFQGNVTIAQNQAEIKQWTLAFDAGFNISQIWNAVILSHPARITSLDRCPYNQDIPVNGQAVLDSSARVVPLRR